MSDYIERLMGKGASTRRSRPGKPGEKHSVRRDSFDKRAWSEITDQVPALGEQVAAAQERHDERGAVAYEDLFNLLNQGDPRFTDMAKMLREYGPQHAMFESMFSSEDFQWVRNQTKYDEYSTALAMLSMKRQMDEAMEQVEDVMDALSAAEKALAEAMQAAQDFLDAGGVPAGPSDEDGKGPILLMPGGNGESEQHVIDRLQGALDGVDEAESDAAEATAEAAAQLRSGANKAREAIENEQEQASSFGASPGVLKKMSYDERRKLSQRIDQTRLAKFAKMLGGFRMAFDAARRKRVRFAPAEIVDVELGNSLTSMLPSERVYLAIPELEDLFWLRHHKRELLQYVTTGPEGAGKGPIIVVCDESYSMAATVDGDGNTREAWSKAVALGLVDQAKRDNRDFIYIGFASAGEQWETHFSGGVYDHNQIIDFAEHFFAGGTHYEGPLTRAMEIIGMYEKKRQPKPDVVFITDAECHVGDNFIDAWREVKDRADVRCFGIQIGGTGRYTAMEQLVDQLIQINELNATPDAVMALFTGI